MRLGVLGSGKGSNFVAIQQGTIHVFPNDQAATQTKVFLNIESKVYYNDKENEQGLLGLAFHPKFKTNGEFFVFYTTKKKDTKSKEPPANVISRFKVSKDDPDKADPNSEVSKALKSERTYYVLEELGVEPGVGYQVKVRNRTELEA